MFHLRNGSRHFTPDVLRDQLAQLSQTRSACTFHVGDGFSERILYFTGDGLQLLSLGDRSGPDVPAYLLERGRIDQAALDAARDEAKRLERGVLDVLVTKGVLTPDEEEDLSRRLTRNEVLDLVFWEESCFRVSMAPPPSEFFQPDRPVLAADLSYAQLREDLTTWIKAWSLYKMTLHGDASRLTLKDSGMDALKMETGPTGAILGLVKDGIRLRKLWRALDMELPELCERLVQLAESRWVAVAPAAQVTMVGTIEKAIEVLEASLARSIGKELVRERLVNLYQRSKQLDKACEHLQLIADEMGSRGDWETASESLREIVGMKPESSAALAQAVKLYLGHGAADKARRLTFATAQTLLKERKPAELKVVAGILDGIPEGAERNRASPSLGSWLLES